MDLGKFSKAIAAFFGGGVPSYLSTIVLFWLGLTPVEPSVLQSAVVGIFGGLIAAATVYFSPANTPTVPQVVAAIRDDTKIRHAAAVETRN